MFTVGAFRDSTHFKQSTWIIYVGMSWYVYALSIIEPLFSQKQADLDSAPTDGSQRCIHLGKSIFKFVKTPDLSKHLEHLEHAQ